MAEHPQELQPDTIAPTKRREHQGEQGKEYDAEYGHSRPPLNNYHPTPKFLLRVPPLLTLAREGEGFRLFGIPIPESSGMVGAVYRSAQQLPGAAQAVPWPMPAACESVRIKGVVLLRRDRKALALSRWSGALLPRQGQRGGQVIASAGTL
jgi:hypothetical protein